MKKINLVAIALLVSFSTFAQKWNVDKAHSKLGFTVTHLLISEVDGNFKTFTASITSAADDFSDAVFELSADVNSINTDNEMRDNDLKSPKFFDAAQFSSLSFKSKSFTKVADKKYKMSGDLTMHGVTKPVTLDVTLAGITEQRGKKKAGFKITGTIKRSDFSVGTIPVAVVSDEVEIRAVGEFGKE